MNVLKNFLLCIFPLHMQRKKILYFERECFHKNLQLFPEKERPTLFSS